jgi:hypothetical protein
VPVREEAKLVPLITNFCLASVVGIGGLLLLGVLDEEPKESAYLINVIFVSNKFVIHTISLEAVCVFVILTAEEATSF